MAYWQIKARPFTNIQWGECQVHAVVSAMFTADVYLVEADEAQLEALKQRHADVIVDRARDGYYRDVQSNSPFQVSENATVLEWTTPQLDPPSEDAQLAE
jgi:hypothetical protein